MRILNIFINPVLLLNRKPRTWREQRAVERDVLIKKKLQENVETLTKSQLNPRGCFNVVSGKGGVLKGIL